jgi:hypothetical protein
MNQKSRDTNREIRKSWDSWGKRFAREVEGLWLTSSDSSFLELVKALGQIRKKYLAEPNGNAKKHLEIERRISEHALEFALSHQRPLTTCRRMFVKCASFGFTDPSREAHFRLLYAESMAKRGHRKAALAKIRETVKLLDLNSKRKKLDKNQDQMFREWSERITRGLHADNAPRSA